MKNFLRILIGYLLIFSNVCGQSPATYNSADIYLQLKKMNVLGSVLYIAAHPDDENTRLLAYLAKGKLYKTGYLSLTRGDGGQNLIGDEQGVELGLIRTQELLAARRNDGAEQFFSRAYDFGFSKTATEALQIWGHDKILSDVVWVIRKFKPDVIITRFPGDERAGHGHHQASEILAKEAYTAAADSTKFPEQFTYGVKPWQAKRILWNTYNFGGNNTTSENQFKMDAGVYSSLLGESFGEIASESRSEHKSQGFGVARQRGEANEYFELTAGSPAKNSLLDGVDTTWQRTGNAAITAEVEKIIKAYDFEHPENSVPSLTALYKTIEQLPDQYWKTQKLQELSDIITECSGLFAEATSINEYAVQGGDFKVQFTINKRNATPLSLKNIQLSTLDTTLDYPLETNQNFAFSKNFNVPADAEISQPYWLKKPLQSGSFDVSDQQMIGKAQSDPAYTARFIFTVNGIDFTVNRPVQYKYTDPVKGEVYEPFPIVPVITGKFDQPLYLLEKDSAKPVLLHLQTKDKLKKVNIQLTAGKAWQLSGGHFNDSLAKNATEDVKATINTNIVSGSIEIHVIIDTISDYRYNSFNQQLLESHSINYEHIPPILYYSPVSAETEKINIVIKGHNIGYITGAGDKVPQALQQMGYFVKYLLAPSDFTDENLKQFDAIIAGVRVYNVNDWMSSKYDVLMRYIQNGGNYIVQYNTGNFDPSKIKIGPYPFTISRTRVTEENAKLSILLPDNSALNYPNKITLQDFDNWIQERSTYQAERFDNHYQAPLSMHDTNETESNGSLIITPYGKGNFVYAGLVFFRQLPAGIPGAYRLMANLIALPQNK